VLKIGAIEFGLQGLFPARMYLYLHDFITFARLS